jgi:predicted nicotinamide N-methyase
MLFHSISVQTFNSESFLFTVTCVGIDMNAILNRVTLKITKENLVEDEDNFQNWDIILIGDLFYDWRVMDPLLPRLYEVCRLGKTVLLGDPSMIVKHNRYNVTTLAVYNMTEFTTEWSGHTDTEVLLLKC